MDITSFSSDEFSLRHNSINKTDKKEMLKLIGVKSLDELIDKTIPDTIKLKKALLLDSPKSESDFLSGFNEYP